MSDLNVLIDKCVAAAKAARNSDHFSLECRDGLWRAEAAPLTAAAMVGELRFEFKGTGPTPEAAVGMLLFSLGSEARHAKPQS